MHRLWDRIAEVATTKPKAVLAVIVLVSVVLAGGATRLTFATGQDSYLNTNEQVYKDNVVYQRLFGGQAMLTVIRMDPGHTRFPRRRGRPLCARGLGDRAVRRPHRRLVRSQAQRVLGSPVLCRGQLHATGRVCRAPRHRRRPDHVG